MRLRVFPAQDNPDSGDVVTWMPCFGLCQISAVFGAPKRSRWGLGRGIHGCGDQDGL